MGFYFDDLDSIYRQSQGDIKHTLSVMADRYMGENPEHEYTARPFTMDGIMRNKDYRYVFDGNAFFPNAEDGNYVYLWGKIRRGGEGALRFTLIPYGPVKMWMDGTEVFASDFVAERFDDNPITFDIPVKKGWNNLVLRFTKTKAGFGAEFGTWLGKLDYYFFHGRSDWEEMEGFDYTCPTNERVTDFPCGIEKILEPMPEWTDEQKKAGNIARVFGGEEIAGKKIVCRSSFVLQKPSSISIEEKNSDSIEEKSIYIDEKLLEKGESIKLTSGLHQIVCVLKVSSSFKNSDSADSQSKIIDEKKSEIALVNPLLTEGVKNRFPWMFAGPFEKTADDELVEFNAKNRNRLVGSGDEKTWWRLDMKGGWIRLYNENALFGHWDYPLGVTLYGMIETARFFDKSKKKNIISDYVVRHVKKAVGTLEYALFDKARFGGATAVHHLLTSIDSLDDCGSFASLMLEVAKDHGDELGDYGSIASYVGDYICKKQARLDDGSFFRKEMMHKFHNGTMWADDLYMSVPFLCRYAAFKNDPAVLDDAARQFFGFKKRLYMEDKKLMAHVYDFRRNMNTGIPWGRGNGWTIFSLTELLLVLPENHPARPLLLDFYNELAEGYLSVQGEDGMWRQVLDMKDSYPESSCTAMFICAFSRGIRNGWLCDGDGRYHQACERAWKALEKTAIDSKGNLYGVCRGSEFAFNPRYYSEHLLPQLNNTHGIGIVLLAGVEMLRLEEFSI